MDKITSFGSGIMDKIAGGAAQPPAGSQGSVGDNLNSASNVAKAVEEEKEEPNKNKDYNQSQGTSTFTPDTTPYMSESKSNERERG